MDICNCSPFPLNFLSISIQCTVSLYICTVYKVEVFLIVEKMKHIHIHV